MNSTTDVLGHPRGLTILFMTEMWERFSYYGMKALLIFYLTKYFLFDDEVSTGIYGAYVGLVYAMPVLGGYLADKYLGARKAVLYGGILLVLGHSTLAYEGSGAGDTIAVQAMFLALALVATGVGFLKANISAMVGHLYPDVDVRRDSGFLIFYMGINIGAFLSTLLVGTIGELYGWSYGFGLAGIGMLIGLVVFIWGQKYLDGAGDPENPEVLKERVFSSIPINKEVGIYILGVFVVLVGWWLLQNQQLVGSLLGLLFAVSYGYIVLWQIGKVLNPQESRQVITVLILTVFSVVFWTLFEQAGSSINLFTDRVVDRKLDALDIEFVASNFQSLNAGFIILLAPVFAGLWVMLERRNIQLSYPFKFAMGIIQAGLGFFALTLGIYYADGGYVAMGWLVLTYLLHTTGELWLSPVGLAMVSKLSPKHMVGLMFGAWFLASAVSGWLSGVIAGFASVDREVLATGEIDAALEVYNELFTGLGIAGVAVGLLLLLLTKPLNKWLGKHDSIPGAQVRD